MKKPKILRGLYCIRFKYDFEKWICEDPRERPGETAGGAQRVDTDVESRIARLEAAAAASKQTAERLLKEREVAQRREEWKAIGDRLLQAGASFNWGRGPSEFDQIKAVFQEIEKDLDYFNSEQALEYAALRLAKIIYSKTYGLHGKFDWDKLIGESSILKNAFSEETRDIAASLAEIEFRAGQYPSHSRIRTVYAKRYMDLVRGEKDASKRAGYLLRFRMLDDALKDDAKALELFTKMADSNLDNEAIVLLAQRAREAMKNETYVSDVDRRRIVLNFIDDVQVARRRAPAPSESTPMIASNTHDAATRTAAADDEADAADRAEEEGGEGEAAGEAPTAEGAATGRARRAEAAPKMTDERRVKLTERSGTDIFKLKAALGLAADATDAKFVAAMRAKQTELWLALEAAGFGTKESFAKRHPKFASAEKFPDGIWGGATRDALITVATSVYVDKKWQDLFAALGGGERKEKVAESATSPPVKIAVKNRPGKPESIPQYRGNIDPANARKNDVLIINDDFTAELSGGGGVDLHEGARVAIEDRYREENASEELLFTAWTQGGQLIYLPVGKARKAADQDVALFQKARHGAALAQGEEHMDDLIARERAAFDEKNENLFNNAPGFALITAGAVIERTGWTSRTNFGEKKVNQDTLVAIRSIDNSEGRYVIRTEDGALGYIRKNAIKDGRIISRAKDEPINVLLARLQTPPAPVAAAPKRKEPPVPEIQTKLDKLDFKAGGRYQQLTADYNELHKGDIVYRIDGNKYLTKSGAEINIAPNNLGPVKPPAGVTLASALNQAVADFIAMRERVKHDTAVASARSAGTAG